MESLKLRRTESGCYRHESGAYIYRRGSGWFGVVYPDGTGRSFATLTAARAALAGHLGLEVAQRINPHVRDRYASGILETQACRDLAFAETNDCTVRALAVWAGIPYTEAHAMLRDGANRPPRKGCYPGHVVGSIGRRIEIRVDYVDVRGSWSRRQHARAVSMTLGAFVKAYPRGRFYVIVRGHALAVIDGIIHDWHAGLRRPIESAWEF